MKTSYVIFLFFFLYLYYYLFQLILIIKKNAILRNACYRGIQKLDKWFPKFDSNNWKSTYQNIFFGIILDPRFKDKRFPSWGLSEQESQIVIQEFKDLFERLV